jgi:hypothetical protein
VLVDHVQDSVYAATRATRVGEAVYTNHRRTSTDRSASSAPQRARRKTATNPRQRQICVAYLVTKQIQALAIQRSNPIDPQ